MADNNKKTLGAEMIERCTAEINNIEVNEYLIALRKLRASTEEYRQMMNDERLAELKKYHTSLVSEFGQDLGDKVFLAEVSREKPSATINNVLDEILKGMVQIVTAQLGQKYAYVPQHGGIA